MNIARLLKAARPTARTRASNRGIVSQQRISGCVSGIAPEQPPPTLKLSARELLFAMVFELDQSNQPQRGQREPPARRKRNARRFFVSSGVIHSSFNHRVDAALIIVILVASNCFLAGYAREKAPPQTGSVSTQMACQTSGRSSADRIRIIHQRNHHL